MGGQKERGRGPVRGRMQTEGGHGGFEPGCSDQPANAAEGNGQSKGG